MSEISLKVDSQEVSCVKLDFLQSQTVLPGRPLEIIGSISIKIKIPRKTKKALYGTRRSRKRELERLYREAFGNHPVYYSPYFNTTKKKKTDEIDLYESSHFIIKPTSWLKELQKQAPIKTVVLQKSSAGGKTIFIPSILENRTVKGK